MIVLRVQDLVAAAERIRNREAAAAELAREEERRDPQRRGLPGFRHDMRSAAAASLAEDFQDIARAVPKMPPGKPSKKGD